MNELSCLDFGLFEFKFCENTYGSPVKAGMNFVLLIHCIRLLCQQKKLYDL